MSASGTLLPRRKKRLRNVESIIELAPDVSTACPDVENIIIDYWFDARDYPSLSDKEIKEAHLFYSFWKMNAFALFKIPLIERQTLALVYHAGSLDQVETCIRKDPGLLLKTFTKEGRQGTLLQLAIIGLDHDYVDQHQRQDKGMAELLLSLHQELQPKTWLQALGEAYRAFCKQKEDYAQSERQLVNQAAVEKFFAIINNQNNAQTTEAIRDFRRFVASKKPDLITDNGYSLEIIELISTTAHFIATNAGKFLDGRTGKLAKRFREETLGMLQQELPERMRQASNSGFELMKVSSPNDLKPFVLGRGNVIRFLFFPKNDPGFTEYNYGLLFYSFLIRLEVSCLKLHNKVMEKFVAAQSEAPSFLDSQNEQKPQKSKR